MAILGNSTYVPTMNELLAHWGQVEAALLTGFVVSVDGAAVAKDDFEDQRDGLEAAQDAVQDKLTDLELARGQIALDKAQLHGWLIEFNGLILSYYQGTKFLRARPEAPGLGDGQEVFLRPMKDIKNLWLKVNVAPARPGLAVPVVLSDGTTQAVFATAVAAAQMHYDEIAAAEQAVDLERAERNLIQEKAYETMKQYRLAVPPRCAQHPALVSTLPRLTPEKGSTPEALEATAVVLPDGQIEVTHAAVTQAGIKRVALRGNVGTTYEEDDAVTYADHLPAAPPVFVLGWGSVPVGGSLALKVYVINETDNEAGSTTLVVTRPAV
jgi:hypothetical protein